MSQFGLFLTLDIDTILAIQARAVALILEGKTIMQWQGEGTEATKQFAMNPMDVMEECNYALRSLNPNGAWGQNIKTVKPFHL